MQILVAHDMGRVAAELIAGRIKAKPNLSVAWCTGRTVIPVYAQLTRLIQREGIAVDRVRSFGLDEYYALPPDHPALFRHFLQTRLFEPAGMRPTRLLDGALPDWEQEGSEFEAAVADAGGIDLLLDGIGANGHLGFNEPGSPFGSETRLVDLTPESREGQLSFFPSLEEVPHQALTRGVRNIMLARSIVLMASGAAKARPLKRAFLGRVCETVPCSVLQLHPDLTLVLDPAAAEPLLRDARTTRLIKEVRA